jgi:hypothetical protein
MEQAEQCGRRNEKLMGQVIRILTGERNARRSAITIKKGGEGVEVLKRNLWETCSHGSARTDYGSISWIRDKSLPVDG